MKVYLRIWNVYGIYFPLWVISSGHLALIRASPSAHHPCHVGRLSAYLLGRVAQHLHGLHQVHHLVELPLLLLAVVVRDGTLELVADLASHLELLVVPRRARNLNGSCTYVVVFDSSSSSLS